MDPTIEFDDLYAEGWPRLMGLLISAGGSRADAEEIAQGAYEKLLRNWSRVGGYDDPQSWVRTVAVRDLTSRGRRAQVAWRKRSQLSEPEWVSDEVDSLAASLDLRATLASLSLDQRTTLLLYYVEDLSVVDVAELLDVSVGTVKSRLARGRARLAQHLSEPVEDLP